MCSGYKNQKNLLAFQKKNIAYKDSIETKSISNLVGECMNRTMAQKTIQKISTHQILFSTNYMRFLTYGN